MGRLVQLALINDVAEYQITDVPEGFGHRPAGADDYQLRVIEEADLAASLSTESLYATKLRRIGLTFLTVSESLNITIVSSAYHDNELTAFHDSYHWP